MTSKIGVIGVGMIGQDHIRRLTHVLSNTRVVAVTDVDPDRAVDVAGRLPSPARVHSNGQDLIADDDVDGVIVASWGPTHEEYVLAAIEAGKPSFCEKPLATSQDACLRILDAEVSHGQCLVQVGYMRRYDHAYRAMKQVIDSGDIGNPLLVHSRHRNPTVPDTYTPEMAITDTAVHDFDIIRWLLGDEYASARVLRPRPSRHGGDLQDPLLMVLESRDGVLVDIETSVNIRYGYDIRGEVVGEDGTVALADSSPVLVRRNGVVAGRVPEDWRERFIRAYDVELQEWVDAIAAGADATGPSSWDGYAAAVVSDAVVEALHSGETIKIKMRDQPALYADRSGSQ
jgi:myo-inositol 2-dehydrogenase/D-chiro-inositol 1-dehydrogenase